ncbi:hypothetical protein CP980_11235 [Streptomyces vinaceus]|uniref:Uncharacterized protein n=1 Tax=Streptomyces vinaceus TaxID=1960 RepID=A0A5J6J6J1_STRVI|nr:hypothetical protein CP980_11235 [Streptomyces vinaceus]
MLAVPVSPFAVEVQYQLPAPLYSTLYTSLFPAAMFPEHFVATSVWTQMFAMVAEKLLRRKAATGAAWLAGAVTSIPAPTAATIPATVASRVLRLTVLDMFPPVVVMK